jgi:hypothetical protein
MELKPGWKTTEFWTSSATAIAGILTMIGVFTPADSAAFTAGATQAIGGLVAIVPVIMYAISRGKVKANLDAQTAITVMNEVQDVMQALGLMVEVADEEEAEEPTE